MTQNKHADKIMELHNTIAFGNDTVLKSIANCQRIANSKLTLKWVGQSNQKRNANTQEFK